MKQFLHKLFCIESFRAKYKFPGEGFFQTSRRMEHDEARDLAKILGGEVIFDPK